MAVVHDEPDEQSGGLSPNALIVYISADMLPRWRLQKSLALDNAAWALKYRRPDIAAANVKGARFCHLQILRIKAHLRKRATGTALELKRVDARITELLNAKAHDPALGEGADSSRPPRGRQNRHGNREGTQPQHQDGIDLQVARVGETRAAKGLQRRDPAEISGGAGSCEVPASPRPLTPRLRQVALLAAQDLSNDQIGQRIQQSAANAGAYVSMAKKALGLADRSGFAEWARGQG